MSNTMTSPIKPVASPLKSVRWCPTTDFGGDFSDTGLRVVLQNGLEPFSALRSLLLAASNQTNQDIGTIVTEHKSSIMLTVPDLLGQKQRSSGHFFNAENVGSSVIRRISRESVHLTDAIDDLARLVLRVLEMHDNKLQLVNAEQLDRPSARVLYRVFQLSDSSPLDWVWGFSHWLSEDVSKSDPCVVRDRFYRSRNSLFQVLAERMQVVLDPKIFSHNPVVFEPLTVTDSTVLEVSQALIDQNYDRLYLAAGYVSELTPKNSCNVWRMICIADANMGRIDDALESIELAYEYAKGDPWLMAECLYMKALIATKRRYDLKFAESLYQQALSLLSLCDPDDERTKIEKAWATNGLALVRTIRSKQLPEHERQAAQMKIFLDEAAAFVSVSRLGSAQALYLQLNLLANMTLLLEVMERNELAASFWERAFYKFRGLSSQERQMFEVTFLYRLGLLQFKSSDKMGAMNTFDKAVRVPGIHSQSFIFERVLLAKGYVELNSDERERASETFVQGCKLSLRLKHAKAFSEHLAGLKLASSSDSYELFNEWRSKGAARGFTEIATEFQPSPKLPSYVPLIDLEASPRVDLNRYLANDRSSRSLTSVLGDM